MRAPLEDTRAGQLGGTPGPRGRPGAGADFGPDPTAVGAPQALACCPAARASADSGRAVNATRSGQTQALRSMPPASEDCGRRQRSVWGTAKQPNAARGPRRGLWGPRRRVLRADNGPPGRGPPARQQKSGRPARPGKAAGNALPCKWFYSGTPRGLEDDLRAASGAGGPPRASGGRPGACTRPCRLRGAGAARFGLGGRVRKVQTTRGWWGPLVGPHSMTTCTHCLQLGSGVTMPFGFSCRPPLLCADAIFSGLTSAETPLPGRRRLLRQRSPKTPAHTFSGPAHFNPTLQPQEVEADGDREQNKATAVDS
jgi:hypothetical protein